MVSHRSLPCFVWKSSILHQPSKSIHAMHRQVDVRMQCSCLIPAHDCNHKDGAAQLVRVDSMLDAEAAAGALLEKARSALDAGDYRWTAELLSHLVFAQPDNSAAKTLLAEAYDQMGYRAESGPWRDVYLSAAYELRHGAPREPLVDMSTLLGILQQTPVEKFFQTMSVRLDPEKAGDVERRVAIIFTDLDESYLLTVKNSVLHTRRGGDMAEADATLRITRELFTRMLVGDVGLRETLTSDALELDGSVVQLLRFFSLFETPDSEFNIVTP